MIKHQNALGVLKDKDLEMVKSHILVLQAKPDATWSYLTTTLSTLDLCISLIYTANYTLARGCVMHFRVLDKDSG